MCYILLVPHLEALANAEQDFLAPPSVESVRAVLEDATHLMQNIEDGHGHVVPSSALDHLTREMEELTKELQGLEELTRQVLEKQSKVNHLVRIANSQQLEALVQRLNDTLEREIGLRELERQKPKKSRRRPHAMADVNIPAVVTSHGLRERIGIDVIMNQSELEMKNWIWQVIQDELAAYKEEVIPTVDIDAVLGSTGIGSDAGNCLSTGHVVQQVQQALNDYANDGIGRVDHAQGAQVLHWWTSGTFSPPALSSEKLGSVWWRKFIPEDWERVLPQGWENWSVSIPSYLYHSLVRLKK
jgi:hypothetical protein